MTYELVTELAHRDWAIQHDGHKLFTCNLSPREVSGDVHNCLVSTSIVYLINVSILRDVLTRIV